MFRIMLAEWKYCKYIFIFIYGLTLYWLIKTIIDESDIYGFIVGTSILFFVSMGILAGISTGEKRSRFYASLPLSVKAVEKQGLLYIILINASFFILWIIAYFARYIHQDPGLIWTMISVAMFNLILICLIILGGELSYYSTRPKIIIFVISLVITILLFTATINNIETYQFSELNIEIPLLEAYIEFIKLPAGSLLMSIVAGIFLYLAYIVMINRRSNLN